MQCELAKHCSLQDRTMHCTFARQATPHDTATLHQCIHMGSTCRYRGAGRSAIRDHLAARRQHAAPQLGGVPPDVSTIAAKHTRFFGRLSGRVVNTDDHGSFRRLNKYLRRDNGTSEIVRARSSGCGGSCQDPTVTRRAVKSLESAAATEPDPKAVAANDNAVVVCGDQLAFHRLHRHFIRTDEAHVTLP